MVHIFDRLSESFPKTFQKFFDNLIVTIQLSYYFPHVGLIQKILFSFSYGL